MIARSLLLAGLLASSCSPGTVEPPVNPPGALTAGFVTLESVYNSELMAPYDVLQHSVFRDSINYIAPFVVSPSMVPLTTFEGLTLLPHYSFSTAPAIDILVIPSTAHSMTTDLADTTFMNWLRRAVADAQYVISVCDGAFPLAATGQVDEKVITTFPADRDRLATMFPQVEVRYDARLVVDGKYITSVGGAMSYEPALYLVEVLYGHEHAQRTAEGLVLEWDLTAVPHFFVQPERNN